MIKLSTSNGSFILLHWVWSNSAFSTLCSALAIQYRVLSQVWAFNSLYIPDNVAHYCSSEAAWTLCVCAVKELNYPLSI